MIPSHRWTAEIELLPCENNVRYSGLTDIPAIPGGPAGPRSPCWDFKKKLLLMMISIKSLSIKLMLK